jgi:ArsR family transcriptional regulator
MLTSAKPDMTGTPLLKVLADPLRLRIVELLASEALCTCHLVEETGAGQTTVSHHLRVLRESGMVDTEPCGRFTYYRLRPETLRTLSDGLADLVARAEGARESRRPC